MIFQTSLELQNHVRKLKLNRFGKKVFRFDEKRNKFAQDLKYLQGL